MATNATGNGANHVTTLKVDAQFGSYLELYSALEIIRAAEDVRVVVLDLREPGLNADGDPGMLGGYPLPLVAAWGGTLDEARLTTGLFCDIRVGETGQTLTWVPSMPGSARKRFAAVLGVKESDMMTALAHGMLESGLITAVADGDSLAEAERIAAVVASRGPIATQLAKEAVWRGLGLPFEHALRYETDLTLLLQTTNDRAEGVNAFLEKRTPHFTGT
jgi:enoyl-CoA hydratase